MTPAHERVHGVAPGAEQQQHDGGGEIDERELAFGERIAGLPNEDATIMRRRGVMGRMMNAAARGTGAGGPAGLREILLAIIVLGCVGLIVELLLLEHVDSWTQWIPLVVLVAGIGGAKLLWFRPARWSVRLFSWLMAGFVVTGVAGIWLHFVGNRAFELEMEESLSGWLLAWHSLRGATPALAPGAMILLGLLGLALAWRHPALAQEPTQYTEKR